MVVFKVDIDGIFTGPAEGDSVIGCYADGPARRISQ